MSSDDSSDKNKKKKVKKKGTLWQEAGEEFFAESYPTGSGQDDEGLAGGGGGHGGGGGGAGGGKSKRKTSLVNNKRFVRENSTRRGDAATGGRSGNNGGGGGTTTITYAMSGRHGTFGRTITTNVGYNNTTFGNNGTIYDNAGMLPDLTDLSIPNEQKRWEEVQKIKILPIPMSQKRQLKVQLTTIPMLKLKGWRLLRWKQMLLCHSIAKKWSTLLSSLTFWNGAISEVQVGRGVGIAQLFQLIKWSFKLNLLMCLLLLVFILLPQVAILKPLANQLRQLQQQQEESTSTVNCGDLLFTPVNSSWMDESRLSRNELASCCTQLFVEANERRAAVLLPLGRNNTDNNNGSDGPDLLLESMLLRLSGIGQFSEYSPLFFGFYSYHPYDFSLQQQQQQLTNNDTDTIVAIDPSPFWTNFSTQLFQCYSNSYAFIYLLTQLAILILSFYFIFKDVQLKHIIVESVRLDEGHKFADLVFTGWEHFTRDAESAKFKRKTIRREMKLVLKDEKRKIEGSKRSRKECWKLFGVRVATNLILIGWHVFLGVVVFQLVGLSYTATAAGTGRKVNREEDLVEDGKNNTGGFGLAGDNSDKEQEGIGMQRLIDIWWSLVAGFAPAITIVKVNHVFPLLVKQICKIEKFSQNITLKLTLWRIILSRIFTILLVGIKLYLVAYCPTKSNSCTQCEEGGGGDNDKNDNEVRSSTMILQGQGGRHRSHCWESIFGEHLYKIVLVDLLFKIVIGFILNTLRNCIGLYCPGKFFRRLGLMKFNLATHSLDLIFLQFLSWIGAYFAPFLPLLILIYTFLLFYLNKLTVFVTARGIPNIYKTMRIPTMYLTLKLVSFVTIGIVLTLVIGYAEPSKSCGPFRQNDYPWQVLISTLSTETTGPTLTTIFSYLRHPITLLFITIALSSLGYYYYTLTKYSRATVSLLKNMLVLEGHDKAFLFTRLNSLKRDSLNSSSSIPLTRTRATAILNEDDD